MEVSKLIDFTNCEINKYKYYGGRNGGKICIIYNGEEYMLKFPAINQKSDEHEYSNSCISEYLTCKILKTLNLNVQDTLLGTFNIQGNDKIVVACKDFTSSTSVLKQFAELKNSQIETSKNGYGTELNEIIETIDEQQIYDSNKLKEFFWDMFIADALVGNFDRHNGNWGFLVDENLKKIEIAPIYDCGSCLYPQLTDERICEIINDDKEIDTRIYVFPTSSIKENDMKINYFEYISSLKNEDCNSALKRIVPLVNLEEINDIIDSTPVISDIRKDFYKKMIKERYYKILKFSFSKLSEL